MHQRKYLLDCIYEIEESLNWGKRKDWKHSDFVKLNELIFKETGLMVSVSSLKRVFGKVQTTHLPNISTRNALAKFAGYENWHHFINSKSKKATKNKLKKPFFVALGVFTIIICALLLFNLNKKPESYKNDFSFSASALTDYPPHTVVFNYDVSSISDSVFICYDDSFDPDFKHVDYLPRNQTSITHYYKLPDLYRIHFTTKTDTLATYNLLLKSPEWTAYYVNNLKKKYVKLKIPQKKSGILQLTKKDVERQEVPVYDGPLHVKYRFIKETQVKLDQSETTIKIKNLNQPNDLLCYRISIILTGDSANTGLKFTRPNCHTNAVLFIDNKKIKGRYHDLSFLGQDFSSFKEIKLRIKNNTINYYYENKYLAKKTYSRKLGNLNGILIDVHGNWQIDNIHIQEINSNNQYYESFGQDNP
jgi:hypothetical protein